MRASWMISLRPPRNKLFLRLVGEPPVVIGPGEKRADIADGKKDECENKNKCEHGQNSFLGKPACLPAQAPF